MSSNEALSNEINSFDNSQLAYRVSPINSMVKVAYDSINFANSTLTTDVLEFYQSGLSGTKVATLTIIYTDSSKQTITSIAKT